MSKFVLAREGAKGGLPGTPVAVVRSSDPELDGLFLCTVRPKNSSEVHAEMIKKPGGGGAGSSTHTRMGHDLTEDYDFSNSSGKKHKHKSPYGDDGDGEHGPHGAGAGAFDIDFDPAHPPSDSDDEHSHRPKKKTRKGIMSSNVDDALHRTPLAHMAAEAYETDTAPIPVRAPLGAPSAKADMIKLPLGSFFEPLPSVDPHVRTTAYLAGKAGSGKSTYGSGLVRRYQKLFPGREVYGVCKTKLKEDAAYASLGIKQLPLSFFAGAAGEGGAFDVKKVFGTDGCLVLFDDWDSLEKKDLVNVHAAITDVLNLGRKMQISVIVTSHLLTNYNQTRGIIHEANFMTIFPQHELYQSVYYLCQKLGVSKELIGRLRSKGRWVTFHNSEPTFCLSETEAEMV